MTTPTRSRQRQLAVIFLVSLAGLLLEVGYTRIVSYKLGPKPDPVPAGDGYGGYDPDEIPF